MTILIIDDDSSMIEMLLKTIDWDKLEIDERLTASSAAAARQIIQSRPVDLMLCDIEMPGGSGMELLGWMRENGLETPSIFLTNHTRFDYARTAIKLGAADFVSKMSPPEELADALRRGVNIVKTQRIQKRYVDYGRYWEENSGLLWRQFWLDLIHEAIPPEREAICRAAGERLLKWYGTQLPGGSLRTMPVLCTVQLGQETITGWPAQELDYCVYNVVSEVLYGSTNSDHIVALESQSGRAVYAVMLDEKDAAGFEKKAKELVDLFRQVLLFSINIYYSGTVFLEEVSKTVRQLQEADRSNVTEPSGVHVLPVTGSRQTPQRPQRMDFDRLSGLLAAGQSFQAVSAVKEYFSSLPRSQITLDLLQEFQYDYTQVLYSVLTERHIEAHLLFAQPAAKNLSRHATGSLIDMLKWVSHSTNAVVAALAESSRSNTIIGTVKKYIDENYGSHITKADLGALVFLNPDYLAKLFKKETGTALSDYISQVRIEKAKILLSDGSVPLTDVAMRTGFDYYSYFSTIFKKATGISPSDYRRQLLGNEE